MSTNFSNQVVLISGATRGIGKAIAESSELSNSYLILTGTNEKEIQRLDSESSDNIKWICVDFTNDDETKKFLKHIKNISKIDVVINNAGMNYIETIINFPLDKFDDIMNVNLRTPFRLIQVVASKMKQFGYGRIVNIASILGSISMSKRSAYSASKSGLIGMSKSIALDLAEYNILINCVSPGFINTDLTREVLTSEQIADKVVEIPMKRLGTTKEIADLVLYLASNSNTYITGQDIISDGGYTIK